MKKKGLVFLIFLTAAVLGVSLILFRAKTTATDAPGTETESVVYVCYAGTHLSLDRNWVVCENTSDVPSGIPEVTGVDFSRLVYGSPAEPEDPSALQYVVQTAVSLKKHGISVEKIVYKNRMITLVLQGLSVELGKNDATDEKINDLYDMLKLLQGRRGTLYMQNGNAGIYGYTFREQ